MVAADGNKTDTRGKFATNYKRIRIGSKMIEKHVGSQNWKRGFNPYIDLEERQIDTSLRRTCINIYQNT